MDKFDFNGKKIVVTGASSGVGRETAILLSHCGAKLVLIARREEELQKTFAMMEGDRHTYKVLDLSDFDKVVECIKAIVDEDGIKIDCVAHCAGMTIPVPLRTLNKETLDTVMYTNFYSFAAILKCAASKKLFNEGGAIVGISSCVATYGQVANGGYGASKGAIDALAVSAARELASRKIRVNTIRPSGIRTEMVAKMPMRANANMRVEDLPDSLLKPEGVASVLVAMLSNSMRYISGTALDVDVAKDNVL